MKKETKKFDAEIGKVLNLMINSIYTNKDIFLRELISNSSDACDKLRFMSQTDNSLLNNDSDFKINISFNSEKKTITIRDNGIGMSYEDLNKNLGTIANSGTQKFIEQLTGDKKKDNQMIGQFGVGFYSGLMVADSITVTSKKAGSEDVFIWKTKGGDEYEIEKSDCEFTRGTEIILHIKESEESFVDEHKLKHIIKSYSEHISIPIILSKEEGEDEQVNASSALWMNPKSEISEDQYKDFYKTVSYSSDDPWLTLHNHNEGVVEFTNLLFIPSEKTFDLFHPDRKSRVKLYVNRVFIGDENINLVPSYLRFLRGIIDSSDLPLNISREALQNNSILEKIKSSIIKKTINELKKQREKDTDRYLKFWGNFGAVLKEGLCEFNTDHEKILEISLFYSALHKKMISLDEYITDSKDENKTIYYLSGDAIEKLQNNPQIEGFLERGIDVLLFIDGVDDFWVNVNSKYKEYEIKSVTRADIDLDSKKTESEKKDTEENEKDEEKLLQFFREALGEKIKDVKISKKLASSPSSLSVAEGAMDIKMERYLVEQKQLAKAQAKILEINPNHNLVKKLIKEIDDDSKRAENQEIAHLLYDQACIIEGEPVVDPGAFSRRFNLIIDKAIENV